MAKTDPRTPRDDPREPLWLSVVTILFCLGEGAIITIVLLEYSAELFTLTTWLADRTIEIPAIDVQQVWLGVVVWATVFFSLGALILARKATVELLEATYTSSRPFKERKAETLTRLIYGARTR